MTISLSTAVRNAKLDAITTQTGNAGLLRIYDATGGVPANVGVAISTQVKLAELTCGSPFAPASSGAVLTANAITQDSSADATGTAAFYRVYKSDGTTAIAQGTVTATGGGGDLQLNTTSIVIGGPVGITSFTFTEGNP